MVIGDAAIVEFSQPNNATYIYRSYNFPVPLDGRGSVNIRDLRSSACVERLIHRPGWQELFKQKLRARFNINPDGGSRNAPAAPELAFTSRRTPPARCTKAGFGVIELIELRNLMEREDLEWSDLRARGGNLRVLSDDVPQRVETRLVEWGFRLKQGKGWWLSATED